MMRVFPLLVALATLLASLTAALAAPLPPRELRLLRVMDPRFPQLDDATWTRARADLVTLLQDLYELPVTIEDQGVTTPHAYFDRLHVDARPPSSLRDAILPPATERAAFVARVHRAIADEKPETVAGYLPRRDRTGDLAEAVVRVFERRALTQLPEDALETMAPWGRALKHRDAPEVVITNLPILYGWHDGVALHALVRGGLIGGFATFDGASRSHGGAVITVHPLLSLSPAVQEVGEPPLDGEPLSRTTAALMAHELSHLLFHVPDNYTHDACLMHPPPGLDYHRFWFREHPLRPCPICNAGARAHVHRALAATHAAAGSLPEALADYRRAVDADARDPELLNEAAWFCAEHLHALPTGLAWARTAVGRAPRASHILDTLGWLEALSGDAAHAAEHLQRARDLATEGKGEITYHLAAALLASGRYASGALAAREAFTQGERPALWSPANALWDSICDLLGQGQRFF